MRSWFSRFSQRRNAYDFDTPPRQRTSDEILLALSTLPLYQVLLTLGEADRAACATFATPLIPLVGQERTARILADALRDGAGVVATCPRELAEHYRDELLRRALPCAIAPA